MSLIEAEIHINKGQKKSEIRITYGVGANRVPVSCQKICNIYENTLVEAALRNLKYILMSAMPDAVIRVIETESLLGIPLEAERPAELAFRVSDFAPPKLTRSKQRL